MGLAYHRKKSGAVYVYSVQNYWDKEKHAPRNKQVCLGRLDPESGEIIPSKRKLSIERAAEQAENVNEAKMAPPVSASAKTAGPSLLLEQIAKQLEIEAILKKCFPDTHREILSLVYYVVSKGAPLYRCEPWSVGHIQPFGDKITSQRISEWLTEISEDDRQRFLSLWLRKITERDYLCYDITSISSYAQVNEYIRYGYNRDGESLPQINMAMVFGQNSGLPAYYRRMQGNVSDVATLKTTLKELDFLGAHKIHFIMDRGFYSKTNIDGLLGGKHNFTIAIPSGRRWVEAAMERHYESIASPENYRQVNDKEVLYVATELYKWEGSGRRVYLHIYFNSSRAGEEFDRFTRQLLEYKRDLEAREIADDDERYARFFTIKDTPKRGRQILFNDAEIQKHRKRYAGFFCIMSTVFKDPMEALRVYRAKDTVENCFDDLKNHLDMKRLRMHSSNSMDSRLFIQFLALIFISAIRRVTQSSKDLKHMSVMEVMENMEPLVKITYSGRYGHLYSEANPIQRKIMEAFGVKITSS